MKVDMIIQGTIGTALLTLDFFKDSAESIDTGADCFSPVKAYGVKQEDAEAFQTLLAEHNFKVTIHPHK